MRNSWKPPARPRMECFKDHRHTFLPERPPRLRELGAVEPTDADSDKEISREVNIMAVPTLQPHRTMLL